MYVCILCMKHAAHMNRNKIIKKQTDKHKQTDRQTDIQVENFAKT